MTEPFILIFNTTSNLEILPSPFLLRTPRPRLLKRVTCQKCLQASVGQIVLRSDQGVTMPLLYAKM